MPVTKVKKAKDKKFSNEFDTTTYLYWLKSMLLKILCIFEWSGPKGA